MFIIIAHRLSPAQKKAVASAINKLRKQFIQQTKKPERLEGIDFDGAVELDEIVAMRVQEFREQGISCKRGVVDA